MRFDPFVSTNSYNPKNFYKRDLEAEFCRTKIEKLESFYIVAQNGAGKTNLIKHVFN